MCPDEPRSRWWHDGWWLGVGNELRMVYCDHYHRDSRYFGYRLYDETKVKIRKGKKIHYKTILGASYFLMGKKVFDQIKSFEVKKVCRGDITLTSQKWDLSLYFNLVGVSCMTATANRSPQLSDMFRQRGSKVVLGGFHPTILPQEAIQMTF